MLRRGVESAWQRLDEIAAGRGYGRANRHIRRRKIAQKMHDLPRLGQGMQRPVADAQVTPLPCRFEAEDDVVVAADETQAGAVAMPMPANDIGGKPPIEAVAQAKPVG